MSINQTMFKSQNFRQVYGDLYASAAVTDEQVAQAKKDMERLEQEAQSKQVGLYKIEIQFGKNHHVNGELTYGMMTLWESGTKLHGGGDALLYICPGKYNKQSTCEHVIPDQYNGRAVVVCPSCFTAWKREDLIGQLYFNLPIQKWAQVIHHWFLNLGMNADIRVKYFYDDIRAASDKEQEKELKGEVLERARSDARRPTRVYPLANIIKDTSAGADLFGRILAFLRM